MSRSQVVSNVVNSTVIYTCDDHHYMDFIWVGTHVEIISTYTLYRGWYPCTDIHYAHFVDEFDTFMTMTIAPNYFARYKE